MTKKTLVATKVNAGRVNAFLEKMRDENNSDVTEMADMFVIGLMVVDYEVYINATHPLGQLSLSSFLKEVVTSKIIDEAGGELAVDTVLAVHHEVLDKHCFVKICSNDVVMMAYHVTDPTASAGEYAVAVIKTGQDASMATTNDCVFLYNLMSSSNEDIGRMIDFMQLNDYESEFPGKCSINIPEQHPRTTRDTPYVSYI